MTMLPYQHVFGGTLFRCFTCTVGFGRMGLLQIIQNYFSAVFKNSFYCHN